MKNSKDVESKKVYQYRLDLDRKGHIGQGRKTSPCLELEFGERSKALDLTNGTRYHGQGLAFRPQEERKLTPREELIALMKKEAESKRLVVLHHYKMQASWLAWGLDNMMKQDRSWQVLLHQCSERFLKFVLNAQLNTLPTPDNPRRWNANKEGVWSV